MRLSPDRNLGATPSVQASSTMQGVYELVIRFQEDDSVLIEPRGRLDADADRHILDCVAAACDTGLTPQVRVAGGMRALRKPGRADRDRPR